jgi:hypothetical protein
MDVPSEAALMAQEKKDLVEFLRALQVPLRNCKTLREEKRSC